MAAYGAADNGNPEFSAQSKEVNPAGTALKQLRFSDCLSKKVINSVRNCAERTIAMAGRMFFAHNSFCHAAAL